jgi:hypothetical protein
VTVQSATSLLYLGAQIIVIPATGTTNLVLKAQLSSACGACVSNKTIKFFLEVNPLTGATNETEIGSAITSVSGIASNSIAISTNNWTIEGAFTITAKFEGGGACLASEDDATLTIAQPGCPATGGGWYTLSGSGRNNFGSQVRTVPNSSR